MSQRSCFAHSQLYSHPNFYDFLVSKLGVGRLWREVQELLKPQNGDRILDVCCGTGSLLFKLSQQLEWGELVGLDHSPQMLKKACHRLKNSKSSHLAISFVLSQAQRIPFPENYFDKAAITLALHEMPYADRLQALREINRVVKKGGKVVISEPFFNQHLLGRLLCLIFSTVEVYRYLKEVVNLRGEVEEAGFRLLSYKLSWGFIQFIMAQKAIDSDL